MFAGVEAAMGKAFVLQGGDCAESFKEVFNANNIRVLLPWMAGQFAKRRWDDLEEKDGVKLPRHRGDNVNGDAFDLKSRPHARPGEDDQGCTPSRWRQSTCSLRVLTDAIHLVNCQPSNLFRSQL